VRTFVLAKNSSSTVVRYFMKNESWEIEDFETSGVKHIYGKSNAIMWGVKWNFWMGQGSSANGLKMFAFVWYLSEIRDNYGPLTVFEYESSVAVFKNISYTKEINLRKIHDNDGNSVVFTYQPPQSLQHLTNFTDFLSEMNFQSKRYLESYILETPGVNFINFVQAAFTCADPNSVKRY